MSGSRPFEFNITDFGGVGDGVTDDTAAFERAISAISKLGKRGGGQLNVPPGKWLTAPFNLTSHMTLFLAEDAEILGIQDEKRWPLMPPLPSYGYGREHRGSRYGSLIHGQNLEDVVITSCEDVVIEDCYISVGDDAIAIKSGWDQYGIIYERPSRNILIRNFIVRSMVSDFTIYLYKSTGHNGSINGQGQSWWTKYRQKLLNHTRGPLVQIMWSNDIVISNITLRDSPFWTFHPYDCKNVSVRNVTILAPVFGAPNTDGIDPAVVSIGSEMSGGVSNVTVENVTVWSSRRAVRIKTAVGRGGYVRHIMYRNLTFDDARVGIVIKTDYNEHPDMDFDKNAFPILENISFTGIHGQGVRVPVRIHGSEEIPVRNVTFRDMNVGITYKKKHIFQCAFVQGHVIGTIFPAPCENLDIYDEEERPVKLSTAQNVTDIDYGV
ncbi:hypothetical protein GOBAR_AA03635 [Gossypium barbadense]|uniref:Rhamnogalacturonase A/B/Epimerase-like pectate lyase domain-containing protein n=1 Tax=Gossypium barbadense TaxID=3634 RepID=A0A2P5YMX1_GOSBA|nr:hypothetical protein GOBAR_AA03635 [Gossypium barbadense]